MRKKVVIAIIGPVRVLGIKDRQCIKSDDAPARAVLRKRGNKNDL